MSNAPALSLAPSFEPSLSVAALAAAEASCGVAIDVDASADIPVYSVHLLSDGGRFARRIAATADETAARRVWCLLARSLRVPRFVAEIGGGFRAVDRMLGPVVCRQAASRRGRRVALRRRPSSRRAIAAEGRFAIHAGEREIICYE